MNITADGPQYSGLLRIYPTTDLYSQPTDLYSQSTVNEFLRTWDTPKLLLIVFVKFTCFSEIQI